MNYETQKEMIDTLNRVVTEQDQVIKAQKEMIKNLCCILVKKEMVRKDKIPSVCLN